MLPKRFKITEGIDLANKLKGYAVSHFDKNSLNPKLLTYFDETHNNRQVISKIKNEDKTIDSLKFNRSTLVKYINQLEIIKSKITFGEEKYDVNIKFMWTDTLDDDKKYKSYNIHFEYYNAIFNLAVLYYNMAIMQGNIPGSDKNIKKESVKFYNNAYYLFKKARDEVPTKISSKERPKDLSSSYLDFCCAICEAFGQISVVKLTEESFKESFELQARVFYGCASGFKKAGSIANKETLKKYCSDEFRNYLENQYHYYKALMFKKYRDYQLKQFEETGLHYGEALSFQGLEVIELIKCEKNVDECGSYCNPKKIKDLLAKERELGQKMEHNNTNIYHQFAPDLTKQQFEKKLLIKPVIPEDLYIDDNIEKIKEDNDFNADIFDEIVPEKLRDMLNRYKTKIKKLLDTNLDPLENENKLKNYIIGLRLPDYLTVSKENEDKIDMGDVQLPKNLSQKIEQVQKQGGNFYLTTTILSLMEQSNNLVGKLKNVLNSFSKEDKDDENCRIRYGSRWMRQPSRVLNQNLVNNVNSNIDLLEKAHQFDLQEKNEISNNSKNIELLQLSLEKISHSIPGRKEDKVALTQKEKELRNLILKLYELKDQLMGIIKNIFKDINDDSLLIPEFMKVIEVKTTENAIYNIHKEAYEKQFSELRKINDNILNTEKEINKCIPDVISDLKNKNKNGPSELANNYFTKLDTNCEFFFNKANKLQKGKNYYNNLETKINDLIKICNNWMIERSDEKNNFIRMLGGNM